MATDEGKLTAILLDMFKDVPSPTKSVRPIFSEPSTMRMWIGGLPKGVDRDELFLFLLQTYEHVNISEIEDIKYLKDQPGFTFFTTDEKSANYLKQKSALGIFMNGKKISINNARKKKNFHKHRDSALVGTSLTYGHLYDGSFVVTGTGMASTANWGTMDPFDFYDFYDNETLYLGFIFPKNMLRIVIAQETFDADSIETEMRIPFTSIYRICLCGNKVYLVLKRPPTIHTIGADDREVRKRISGVGTSLVYCIETTSANEFKKLKDYRIDIVENLRFKEITEKFNPDDLGPLDLLNDSNIEWNLHCLISFNIIHRTFVTVNLMFMLSEFDLRRVSVALESLFYSYYDSFDISEKNTKLVIDSPESAFAAIKKEILKVTELPVQHKNKDYINVKYVKITPSRIYCLPATREPSNRMVRKYLEYSDNFLRVSFVDETFDKIFPNGVITELVKGVREHMDGISIGDRKYEFVAFSSSQLRDSSCWFFESTRNGINPQSILRSLGEFKDKIIAKRAARMGQSLSCTIPTIDVPAHFQRDISDVTNDVDKDSPDFQCYSDGCGNVSGAYLKLIAEKFNLDKTPAAIQIRYGGCKGMLVYDANMSPTHHIELRPSMKKFESEDRVLEVVRCSSYSHCYLNRHIILLLSTWNIHDNVFLKLQTDMINKLNIITQDTEKAGEFVSDNHLTHIRPLIASMHKRGFDFKEPFLRGIMEAVRFSYLSDLEKRSRIHVPKGACLLGVLDPTKKLKYGQVFFRLDHKSQPVSIVTGTVVVTKNPCTHPRDILILEAVDIPELHYLKNVLVFPAEVPSRFHIPHTTDASGSDLDGDVYWITWDKSLIPNPNQVFDRLNYYQAPKEDEEVTTDAIKDFFCEFITSNVLGKLCTNWVIFADSHQEKAKAPQCVELAKLIIKAVDYPKKGVRVDVPLDLTPRIYPHFMQKNDKKQYTSTSVIGQLFDEVHETKSGGRYTYPDHIDLDLCLLYDYEEYLQDARKLRKEYNSDLMRLMRKFQIKDESEAISGCLLKVPNIVKTDKLETIKELISGVRELQRKYEAKFADGVPSDDEKMKKASACYYVTYQYEEMVEYEHENQKSHKMLSFPWMCAHLWLCKLKTSAV